MKKTPITPQHQHLHRCETNQFVPFETGRHETYLIAEHNTSCIFFLLSPSTNFHSKNSSLVEKPQNLSGTFFTSRMNTSTLEFSIVCLWLWYHYLKISSRYVCRSRNISILFLTIAIVRID